MVASINRTASFFASVSFALGLVLTGAAHAAPGDAGSYGGNGGGSFRSQCRPPDALIGINMRSGTALDAVVAICIPLTPDRQEWAGQAYEPTQYWGGGGGGYQKIACQPGDVVRRLRVSRGPWGDLTVVKHIAIECEDLATDYTYKVVPGQTGGTVKGTRWIDCGEGEIGLGIYGRSGALIDKIGLQCGPYRP